jgi:hypothetical protein
MVLGKSGLMFELICEGVPTAVALAAIPFCTWRCISFGDIHRDIILALAGLSEHGEGLVIFNGVEMDS